MKKRFKIHIPLQESNNELQKEIDILRSEFLKKLQDLESKYKRADITVPVSVFHNKLSTLEAVVMYLVVEKKLRFCEISTILKRNQRTIWGAFNRAKNKRISIAIQKSEIKIPISVFADRNNPPLFALVCYLKDNFSLTYAQIARLLDLDPRTVWCVYHKKT